MKNTLRMLLIVYAFVSGTGAFAQVTVPGVTNVLYYEPFSFNNYDGEKQYEASTLVGFFAVGATVTGPIGTDNTWSGSYIKTYNATGNGDVGGLLSFSKNSDLTDVTFSGINIAGSSVLAISFGLAEIYSTYDAVPLVYASVDGGSWIPLLTTGFGTHWPTSDLPAYAGVGTFTGIILPLKDLNGNALVGSTLSINFKQTGKYCQVDDLSVLEVTPVSSLSIAGPSSFSTPNGTFDLTLTGVTPSDAADQTCTWSISGTAGSIDSNTGVVTAVDNGIVSIVAVANDGSGVKSNILTFAIQASIKTDTIYYQNFDFFSSETVVSDASTIPGFALGGATVTGPMCLTPFSNGGYIKPYTTVPGANDDFVGFWGDKVNFLTISGINIAEKTNPHLSFYLAQQYMGASNVPTIKISVDGGPVIALTTTDRGTSLGTKFFNTTFTAVSMPLVDGNGIPLTGSTLNIYLSGINAGQLDDLRVTGEEPGSTITVTSVTLTVPGPIITVSGITVSKVSNTAVLTVGGTLALTATVTPDDATTTAVTWSVAAGTGTASITSTTGVLTGVTAGTVTVTATATDGSAVTGTLVVTVTSGVIQASITNAEEVTISLYPNPVSGGFNISNAGLVKSVVVYDIVGSVSSASYSNGYTDVSGLAPGVYFVKITLLSGKTSTKSIVKQ